MSEQVQLTASTTAPPNPPASIETAVQQSLSELRPLTEKLYANKQQAEGLLLSQVKALFLKFQRGITATRSDYLALLDAASRMPRRGE